MTPNAPSSPLPAALNQAQMESLQRAGLSPAVIRQALQGQIISDASDRAAMASQRIRSARG